MKGILFFNTRKAYLPELVAYKDYFTKHGFICEEACDIDSIEHQQYDVHWHMMGNDFTFSQSSKPKILVHEYHSASTGKFAFLKNILKKSAFFTRKPDLRVFLTKDMESYFGFSDEVDSSYRDMGFIQNEQREVSKNKEFDFLYVGSMGPKRKLSIFIDGFLASTNTEKLYLLGKSDPTLQKKYSLEKQIIFLGAVPYKEVVNYIRRSAICVNYIPDEFPYNCQTSTKLIEYAATGVKFISTNYAWINEFENKTGFRCYKFNYDMSDFSISSAINNEFVPGNIQQYDWDVILSDSEILKKLNKLLG